MKLIKSGEHKNHTTLIFEKWKSAIEAEIFSSRVEHIGSTAIVGALTKGDIDLYVEVPADAHAEAISAIEALGFRIKNGTHRDTELCMLENPDIDNLALQVVARGSKYEFFLSFRDALNNSRYLVEQYNSLKLGCTGMTPEQYREYKSLFIQSVLSNL